MMKHWRLVYLLIPFTFAVFGLMLWCNSVKTETVENGAAFYRSAPAETEAETAPLWEEYVEGEGEPPVWWDPDEPMAIEWEDHSSGVGKMVDCVTDINVGDINVPCNTPQSDSVDYNAPEGIDPGGIDWNICTDLVGWDGHRAEAWEMDLLARVFYLEFWGTSLPCSEAGCDAILRLWESGEKGRTLGEVLSSRNEDGSWTYSVYPDIWTTDYDEDGLAWCRDFTAERFAEGPVWIAPYFRLDYYHDWAVPAYQIGNVFFSVAK